MATYIIGYDLRKRGRDYGSLYKALAFYVGRHVLESNFVIETEKSPTEVRDHLSKHMDANDGLFVMTVSAPWATKSLNNNQETANWLTETV